MSNSSIDFHAGIPLGTKLRASEGSSPNPFLFAFPWNACRVWNWGWERLLKSRVPGSLRLPVHYVSVWSFRFSKGYGVCTLYSSSMLTCMGSGTFGSLTIALLHSSCHVRVLQKQGARHVGPRREDASVGLRHINREDCSRRSCLALATKFSSHWALKYLLDQLFEKLLKVSVMTLS